MDPNNNPIPTPNSEPVTPPMPEPVVPDAPVMPGAPTAPEAPATPVEPVEPVAPNPEPVNPVIQPSGNPAPVNPVIQPSAQGGLAATDPIMQPERPPEPDPVEEELKAPMQPASPVPGSIGSAVSGPSESAASEPVAPAENPFAATQTQTPSVSFNDPATQPSSAPAAKPAGKSNKTTLIILIAVAAVIVVVLAIVLIMSLVGGGSSTANNQSSSNNEAVVDGNSDDEEEPAEADVTTGSLSCTRNMTAQELVGINDAVSGAINITAEFDDSEVVAVSRVDSVVYSDEDGTETEPVETEVHEAKTADMTAEAAMIYYLPTNADSTLNLSVDAVQTNYESLDFTCEVL